MKQFDGVFSNRSVDPRTGQPSDQSEELFDFLTGRGHSHGERGTQVAVRSSPDGSAMHVSLLDQRLVEIDSANLQRGADFDLLGGFLSLHGPFSGLHAGSGNIGAGIENHSARLFVSATDDLLGRWSGSEAGLLFYFFPFVSITKGWMLWPKLSERTPK